MDFLWAGEPIELAKGRVWTGDLLYCYGFFFGLESP